MREVEEGVELCRSCHRTFSSGDMVELPEGVWVCDGCYMWMQDLLDQEDADS